MPALDRIPHLHLFWTLVRRDLTLRYQATALGFAWSLLKPLALTAIFFAVFDTIFRFPRPEERIPFALHLLTGVLAWGFFAGAAGEALHVIPAHAHLIKKIRLPLAVLPLAVVGAHLIHFVLALGVVAGLAMAAGLMPGPALGLLPLVLLPHAVWTAAAALLLSALQVSHRDTAPVWELGTTAWFYATPVVYPASLATAWLAARGGPWAVGCYLLNPITPLVVAYRRLLLYAPLNGPRLELADGALVGAWAGCAGGGVLVFWLSWRIFHHYAGGFADEL